jgi:hypothetical protein
MVDFLAQTRPWDQIHPHYKSEADGVRKVLVWDKHQGTVLVPWVGPVED